MGMMSMIYDDDGDEDDDDDDDLISSNFVQASCCFHLSLLYHFII